jgi:heme a synthase
MEGQLFQKSKAGVPQGGVVSPLLGLLGTVLGIAAAAFFLRIRNTAVDATSRLLNHALLSLILLQYLLGVLTLLYHVPVALGVAHQAMAMLLFGVWLSWLHHARTLEVH